MKNPTERGVFLLRVSTMSIEPGDRIVTAIVAAGGGRGYDDGHTRGICGETLVIFAHARGPCYNGPVPGEVA